MRKLLAVCCALLPLTGFCATETVNIQNNSSVSFAAGELQYAIYSSMSGYPFMGPYDVPIAVPAGKTVSFSGVAVSGTYPYQLRRHSDGQQFDLEMDQGGFVNLAVGGWVSTYYLSLDAKNDSGHGAYYDVVYTGSKDPNAPTFDPVWLNPGEDHWFTIRTIDPNGWKTEVLTPAYDEGTGQFRTNVDWSASLPPSMFSQTNPNSQNWNGGDVNPTVTNTVVPSPTLTNYATESTLEWYAGQSLDTWNNGFADVAGDFNMVNGRLNQINNSVSGLQSGFTGVQGAIGLVNTNMQSGFNGVVGALTTGNATLGSINTWVNSANSQLGSVSSQMGTLNGKANDIANEVSAGTNFLNGMKADLDIIERQDSNGWSYVAMLKTNIDGILVFDYVLTNLNTSTTNLLTVLNQNLTNGLAAMGGGGGGTNLYQITITNNNLPPTNLVNVTNNIVMTNQVSVTVSNPSPISPDLAAQMATALPYAIAGSNIIVGAGAAAESYGALYKGYDPFATPVGGAQTIVLGGVVVSLDPFQNPEVVAVASWVRNALGCICLFAAFGYFIIELRTLVVGLAAARQAQSASAVPVTASGFAGACAIAISVICAAVPAGLVAYWISVSGGISGICNSDFLMSSAPAVSLGVSYLDKFVPISLFLSTGFYLLYFRFLGTATFWFAMTVIRHVVG